MARTKIEDISAVENIDKAELEAVQGGGLKKKWKKTKNAATSKSSQDAGLSALKTTASVGNSINSGINATGSGLETGAKATGNVLYDPPETTEGAKTGDDGYT